MSDLWESCEWHDHPEFFCSSATGPTALGDFVRTMGVPERSAQRTLSQMVKVRTIVSDTLKDVSGPTPYATRHHKAGIG